MKVLFSAGTFYPAIRGGGTVFSTFYLSRELCKTTDLLVITTNSNISELLDVETNTIQYIDEQIKVIYFKLTYSYSLAFSLSEILWMLKNIKNYDVQIYTGVFNFPSVFGVLFAKLFKRSVILSARGTLGEWPLKNGSKFKKIWLNIFIKPFVNYIIWHATSEQEKQEILKLFSNARVEIIPNGIYIKKFQKFDKLTKKEFIQKFTSIAPNNIDKIIISMGRLQKKKGFDILIDSFNEVLKKYPNSYLLIAGPDEGEKENLIKQIENLGLRKKVFLIGNIENQDKINFLANADLFVLPSYNENFGNVYLESLSAGTPIVASKNTPWEKVEKYDCGKWVENSVKETSKAMLEILEKDRELMKKNSIKLANKYDLSEIAKEFKSLFERMTTYNKIKLN